MPTDRPPAHDREVLHRLASGDRSALADIYDRYGTKLFRQALWFTGAREAAEDLVQDVFVKLAEAPGRAAGVRDLGAYLARMVHHGAVDRLRRGAVRREAPLVDALLAPAGDDPAAAAERAVIDALLRSLPSVQRETLELRVFEGRSFREIGRITGVTTFTAASRHRLALRRLRKEFERR